MITTDDMLAAAFRYRDTNLWERLGDCDKFAFRLSDGEVGYCCVMGSAGEHFALETVMTFGLHQPYKMLYGITSEKTMHNKVDETSPSYLN